MSAIASTSSASNSTAQDPIVPSLGRSQTLSQKDFLKLLVAQMSSQDPMNPQTDTQMAAQMAQFTSLQQSGTMSDNIATMLTQQQVLRANSMLGGTVTVQVDAKTVISGVVSSMQFNGSTPQIVVDGTAYDLDQVLTLALTPTPAKSAGPTSLLPSTLLPQEVASLMTP